MSIEVLEMLKKREEEKEKKKKKKKEREKEKKKEKKNKLMGETILVKNCHRRKRE